MTLVGANNVGAFLQAFALGKVFENMRYTVEYLSMPNKSEKQSKLNKIIRYIKQRNIRMLYYKVKSGKKYSEARDNLTIVNYNPDKKYDIVVVGSDEIWNVGSKSFEHYPQYFGKGITAERIISYAPSAGNTTEDTFRASGMDFLSFDSLSARDERTVSLVTKFDARKVERVLDPTFLLEDYSEYLPEIRCEKDFIMVYSYGISKKEIKMVQDFAKKAGLPLYSIGTYNSWCDRNMIVTPFEFLAYLKKAKYVITSTFHGTALSINFNKQFVVCVEGSEKLKDLLRQFCLEKRIVTEAQTISDLFCCEIDYDSVKSYRRSQAEKSMAYLAKALE